MNNAYMERHLEQEHVDAMTSMLQAHGYALVLFENGGGARLTDPNGDDVMVMSGLYGDVWQRQYGWDMQFAAHAEIVAAYRILQVVVEQLGCL